jgi:hypothetical protein
LRNSDIGKRIAGMNNNGDAVIGNDDTLQVLFILAQFPGAGADLGGSRPAGGDPGRGPASLNVDDQVRVNFHVDLGQLLGEGLHGGGPGDGDGMGLGWPSGAADHQATP